MVYLVSTTGTCSIIPQSHNHQCLNDLYILKANFYFKVSIIDLVSRFICKCSRQRLKKYCFVSFVFLSNSNEKKSYVGCRFTSALIDEFWGWCCLKTLFVTL